MCVADDWDRGVGDAFKIGAVATEIGKTATEAVVGDGSDISKLSFS